MTASAFYEGTVSHRRFAVREHAFRYRISMAYLDLGDVPAILGRRFRRSDHIGDPERPLAEVVREIAGPDAPRGPVRLLTSLRTLGHCFNPVCFYYLFEKDGETVGAVVALLAELPVLQRSQDASGDIVIDIERVRLRVLHQPDAVDGERDRHFAVARRGVSAVSQLASMRRRGAIDRGAGQLGERNR